MIYLNNIGCYLPENALSNFSRLERFAINENFLYEKIGITSLRIKNSNEDTSDMCVKAFRHLQSLTEFSLADIDCLIVCTQNPDGYGLPHTSAIVHHKLTLNENCAVFDISLGCSGYVYGLSVIKGFMLANGFNMGVLITADPYSKIIDEDDKNTALLFGDAATASLLSRNRENAWGINGFSFGTDGSKHQSIHVDEKRKIFVMNGREVFNFTVKSIPNFIEGTLKKNNLSKYEIDQFILHQGSKFIVNAIREKLELPVEKVPFAAGEYGNTVSSSIPLIIKDIQAHHKRILLCGFGVGLSWGSCILEKL